MALKYKVGDRVRIKSLDWYNENKDEDGDILLMVTTHSKFNFMKPQSDFCGKIVTIEGVYSNFYTITDPKTDFYWTDEMIECKVEEEPNDCEKCGLTRNSIKCLFMDNCPYNKQKNIIEGLVEDKCDYVQADNTPDAIRAKTSSACFHNGFCGYNDSEGNEISEWNLPEGYIFKDENGNVINATKIILEKKNKEYPKTYEECAKVLLDRASVRNDFGYKGELLVALQKLLVCRDAYWKIAGEEMGLGKPWEPDCTSGYLTPAIIYRSGSIQKVEVQYRNAIFSFPTPEMRDAFKENFDPDIERCKELL